GLLRTPESLPTIMMMKKSARPLERPRKTRSGSERGCAVPGEAILAQAPALPTIKTSRNVAAASSSTRRPSEMSGSLLVGCSDICRSLLLRALAYACAGQSMQNACSWAAGGIGGEQRRARARQLADRRMLGSGLSEPAHEPEHAERQAPAEQIEEQ